MAILALIKEILTQIYHRSQKVINIDANFKASILKDDASLSVLNIKVLGLAQVFTSDRIAV